MIKPLTTGLMLLLVSVISWSTTASQNGASRSTELNLLVYNTHGLPAIFAADEPVKRFPQIGKLTEGYDLSLLQEDFAHHDLLLQHLKNPTVVERGSDALVPECWLCSGSGLTLVSNLQTPAWQIRTTFKPFKQCSGWLNRLNDCFAQKGFQLIIMEHTSGHRIYIVNTHLDAGRSEPDREARASQLEQIALTLEAEATNEAILFAGDLNLDWDTQADNKLLKDFVGRLNLVAAQKGGDVSNGWATLDYIYYRSGEKTSLTLIGSGEDIAFTSEAKPLSDHPALFARFGIQQGTSQ